MTEFRPKNFEAEYSKIYDEQDYDSSTDDETTKKPVVTGDDDDWNDVPEDRQTKRTRERKEAKR